MPAPKLSATPGVLCVDKPVAVYGQNTSEILRSVGYSQIEINRLLKNKIIFEQSKSKL